MDLELYFESLARAENEGFHIVDIREDYEVDAAPIKGAKFTHIPMGSLLNDSSALDPVQRHLIVCAHGRRSLATAAELRKRGLKAFSLQGGVAGQ